MLKYLDKYVLDLPVLLTDLLSWGKRHPDLLRDFFILAGVHEGVHYLDLDWCLCNTVYCDDITVDDTAWIA